MIKGDKNPAKRPEVREKIRQAKLRHNPGAIKKGEPRGVKSQFKKGHKINWKGGLTPLYKIIRNSEEYKLWRMSVFIRDNRTCIWCGSKKDIQADHIKRFADYPELRFAIDNGRTLCKECHKTTETYGNRK